MVRTFQSGLAVSLRPPSTPGFHLRLHPSASFTPSPESCGKRPAPRAPKNLAASRKPKSASLGVPHPSSRRQLLASTHARGFPAPSYGPSSTFRTSTTVCSAKNLAGLFHPAATSRVCPTGICPSPRSRTGFPRPIHAFVPLDEAAFNQRPRPRLQGLAPRDECGVD